VITCNILIVMKYFILKKRDKHTIKSIQKIINRFFLVYLFEKSTYFSISVVLQRYEFAIKFFRNVYAILKSIHVDEELCIKEIAIDIRSAWFLRVTRYVSQNNELAHRVELFITPDIAYCHLEYSFRKICSYLSRREIYDADREIVKVSRLRTNEVFRNYFFLSFFSFLNAKTLHSSRT